MTAILALKAAVAAGITIEAVGDVLRLTARAAPPTEILEQLRRHKAEVIGLVTPGGPYRWTALDWHVFFEERAAIAEFDGGMSRAEAETNAYECCVVEYMNRTHVGSAPGECLHCGRAEHDQLPVLPYGTDATGHSWAHRHCWHQWHADRVKTATAALAAMDIWPEGRARPPP